MMIQTVRRSVWHHYAINRAEQGGCQCERAHMPDNCRAVYLYSIWYFAYIVTADCLYAVLG